jgi:hypothetical protein
MEHHAPESAVRHGSQSAPPSLSAPTTIAVRRVVEAYEAGRLVEERLAEAARLASGDAHARGLRPEQMVVAVKRALVAPSLPRLAAERARELRERLVGLSISAYFAQSARATHRDD